MLMIMTAVMITIIITGTETIVVIKTITAIILTV